MKIKIVALFVSILAIINIITAAFLFLNIQIIKAPDITISMEIVEIDSDKAVVKTVMDIYNPNNFEITTKNLKIITTTIDETEVSRTNAKGGTIQSHENKSFLSISTVCYKGKDPDVLKSVITGEVGIKAWFFEKTLPFSMKVITSMGELLSNLVSPDININVDFGKITQRQVNMNFSIDIYNPNYFNLSIKDILIDINNDKDLSVGSLVLPDTIIVSKEKTQIKGNGTIKIEALNSEELIIDMSATVIAHVAGYNKSIPTDLKTTILVPDLKTLFPSAFPTDAVIRSDYSYSFFGLKSEITFGLKNPNDIEIKVKDLTVEVYRVDSNTKRKIAEGSIESGTLKPYNITYLKGSLVIPYRKIFIPPRGGKIVPEWLEVTVRANVTIQGLKNYFWVGMVAYQDFHILKKDKVYEDPEIVDWT